MTSDAKIGLLLGLVFIFIIAFVINGLPRFRDSTNGSDMTTNMVSSQDDTQPIGSRERNAPGVFNWTERSTEQTPEETQPSTEQKEDFRFKMQLPEDVSVAKDASIMETADETESPAAQQVEPAAPAQTSEEITQADKTIPSKPAMPVWPKVYVVCEDDTLADIAKKLYGPEEGNKRVNITRVFEANRQLLKAMDEIYVGQKLTIPPPVTLETQTKENQGTLVDSIFETVKSIGKKDLSNNPDKAKQSVPYVVRQDDNLWRIAVEQLGNGSRYKEISELNANIIKNENDLQVGMLLRIPAK